MAWALILSIDRLAEANISFSFPWLQLLIILVLGLGLGLLASLVPARRSTRLDVLDAIQATQLAEGEDVGAHAWAVEGDLERAPADRAALPHELVHPRLVQRSLRRTHRCRTRARRRAVGRRAAP